MQMVTMGVRTANGWLMGASRLFHSEEKMAGIISMVCEFLRVAGGEYH
jgi:hypothetical protein